MAIANLGPVERDALRDLAFGELTDFLEGTQLPAHRDLSKAGIPVPDRERVILAEAIDRVDAIGGLSQLLDVLGWEPSGRAEGFDLLPIPGAVRALRFCAMRLEQEQTSRHHHWRHPERPSMTMQGLVEDVLGQLEGAG